MYIKKIEILTRDIKNSNCSYVTCPRDCPAIM